MGSMPAARWAGRTAARNAATPRIAAVAARTAGSQGWTPYNVQLALRSGSSYRDRRCAAILAGHFMAGSYDSVVLPEAKHDRVQLMLRDLDELIRELEETQ
jgi:hypothetical protein